MVDAHKKRVHFGANMAPQLQPVETHLHGLCQVTRLHFKNAAATATLSAVNC